MQPVVWMYAAYAALSVGLTIWVARTLSANGRVFLLDVFGEREDLADAVNRLLVVGFYLLNFGYVSLALQAAGPIVDTRAAIEVLSWKVGLVLVVLGGLHFFNLLVFSRIRRRAEWDNAPPPVLPDEVLPPRPVSPDDPPSPAASPRLTGLLGS